MPEALLANLVWFARTLRAEGCLVRAGGVPDAVQALACVGVADRRRTRDALRTSLVCRYDDFVRFDALFDRFWRDWREPSEGLSPRPMHLTRPARSTLRMLASAPVTDGAPGDGRAPDASHPLTRHTYSADELWRRKDFSTYSADDVARARRVLSTLAWTPGARVTRRWQPGTRPTIDARRLMRANARHGGEILTLTYRERRVAPRPLILICDVSGSMEPYTRMLLLFAHSLARGGPRPEVFVFSTRLTRVTRQFAHARIDQAIAGLGDRVRDWSGGTRIGDAIRAFNTEWARRLRRRSPVVCVISDGWDRGDPLRLGREMARLQRSVFRVIWLSPLLGSPGYEPLTRGLRAALPFVDDFLPVHNLSSLEALAAGLDTLTAHRPARRTARDPWR